MRPNDLLRVLRRQPFEPFRLCLVDGTTYEVRHPDQVVVNRSTIDVAGTIANLPRPLAEHNVIVALLHISRLEPIQGQPSLAPEPTGN